MFKIAFVSFTYEILTRTHRGCFFNEFFFVEKVPFSKDNFREQILHIKT
jgi:hypothetical protein